MLNLSKREQMIIVILVILVLIISLFNFMSKKFFKTDNYDEKALLEEIIDEKNQDEVEEQVEPKEIFVHISGQVHNPGIVKLEPGARVIDAVNLAGGLKKEADLDKINLAKRLEDEEKIYIPKVGEDIEVDMTDFQSAFGEVGKVNINTCSKEELLSLPGIGEVIADRIIKYREGNPFKRIEDIMNVSGIGEKKFEGIKDMITVH